MTLTLRVRPKQAVLRSCLLSVSRFPSSSRHSAACGRTGMASSSTNRASPTFFEVVTWAGADLPDAHGRCRGTDRRSVVALSATKHPADLAGRGPDAGTLLAVRVLVDTPYEMPLVLQRILKFEPQPMGRVGVTLAPTAARCSWLNIVGQRDAQGDISDAELFDNFRRPRSRCIRNDGMT